MQNFGDILFRGEALEEQARRGSREAYARMTAAPAPDALSEREKGFIAARDSFYMATVSEDGWPYMQHRGGPKGFLKAIGPDRLAFADYRGNKQYLSTGHVRETRRAALFLMDYPNRARLKILASARVLNAEDDPDLAGKVSTPGEGRVERIFDLTVKAFDWNCPQFITPRFTEDEVRAIFEPQIAELERLKEENAALKAKLGGEA
ncbi:MAG: pyridoxamine 5'-phosphate oxidase family protein [Pseudomonadota bacterium]